MLALYDVLLSCSESSFTHLFCNSVTNDLSPFPHHSAALVYPFSALPSLGEGVDFEIKWKIRVDDPDLEKAAPVTKYTETISIS